jgi:hypothetical protein
VVSGVCLLDDYVRCVVFVSCDYCVVVHSVVVLWCVQCLVLSGTAIFRSCTVYLYLAQVCFDLAQP